MKMSLPAVNVVSVAVTVPLSVTSPAVAVTSSKLTSKVPLSVTSLPAVKVALPPLTAPSNVMSLPAVSSRLSAMVNVLLAP